MRPKVRFIFYAFHVLIWSGLLFLPVLISSSANDYRVGALPGGFFSITVLVNIVIFYVNVLFLYPKLLNRRFGWLYILLCVLLIVASFRFKIVIARTWFPVLLREKALYRLLIAPMLAIYLISLIYSGILAAVTEEIKKKENQTVQALAELKFLRTQISPHFLFNVITNLISLARKKSDALEQSLIMLADLMRYMLYDTQRSKVELRQEVQYLTSYVTLQKMRFGADIPIDLTVRVVEEDMDINIEPMLLIPFVENAFKHGIGFLGEPCIHIKLSTDKQGLTFEVSNRFDPGGHRQKDDSSGIGLQNVKGRLELLYKGAYRLTISDKDSWFRITLKLNLK